MDVLLLLLIALPTHGSAAPTQSLANITIVAPLGTSNHGDPHLLCTPTKASNIAAFIFGNFIAHALTLKPLPGDTIISTFLSVIFALLFPVSGVCRGLNAIMQHAVTRKSPIDKAVAAGAVCEVVRTAYWRPKDNRALINNIKIKEHEDYRESRIRFGLEHKLIFLFDDMEFVPSLKWYSLTGRQVHGKLILPVGYALSIIPPDSQIIPFDNRVNEYEGPASQEVEEEVELSNILPASEGTAPQEVEEEVGLSNTLPAYETNHVQISENSEEEHAYSIEDGAEIEDRAEDREGSTVNAVTNETNNEMQNNLKRKRRNIMLNKPGQELSSSLGLTSYYNLIRSLAAIFQLCYAGFTLIEARGDQISRYGYTAYGLTVIPYLIMSGINLISSALTPDYSHLYLVCTDIMIEAEKFSGAQFSGVIGQLKVRSESSSPETISAYFEKAGNEIWLMRPSVETALLAAEQLGPAQSNGCYKGKWVKNISMKDKFPPLHSLSNLRTGRNRGGSLDKIWRFIDRRRSEEDTDANIIISSRSSALKNFERYRQGARLGTGGVIIGCISIAVLGAMTHFHLGTNGGRDGDAVWILCWLSFGIITGPSSLVSMGPNYLTRVSLLIYGIPAIMGLVIVGKTMKEYGNCIRVF